MDIPTFPPDRTSSKNHCWHPTPHIQVLGNASSSCLSSSTELQSSDGEEILNPLNEEALAALPDFLQENMVDLQVSRIEKWQRKMQETIERNYRRKRRPPFDSHAARGFVEPHSPVEEPSQTGDLKNLWRFERKQLRRLRSASILRNPNTGRFEPVNMRRPRTADAASSSRLESTEQTLQRHQAASALRDRVLHSNRVTDDERRCAIELSAEMGLRTTMTKFAVPVKRSQKMDGIQTKKSGLRGRLKHLKILTLQALGPRKLGPRKSGPRRGLQESQEKSTELSRPASKQRMDTSLLRGPGFDGGARSYRAHLEGYDF